MRIHINAYMYSKYSICVCTQTERTEEKGCMKSTTKLMFIKLYLFEIKMATSLLFFFITCTFIEPWKHIWKSNAVLMNQNTGSFYLLRLWTCQTWGARCLKLLHRKSSRCFTGTVWSGGADWLWLCTPRLHTNTKREVRPKKARTDDFSIFNSLGLFIKF